jgi:hypothetical protein
VTCAERKREWEELVSVRKRLTARRDAFEEKPQELLCDRESGQWDTEQKKDKEDNSKSLEVRTPGKKE